MTEQPIIGGAWAEIADLIRDFEITANDLADCTILLAWYDQGSFEGEAFVLFQRDDLLYEVIAWHCSCYGLENQWKPEETFVQALRYRIERGGLGKAPYSDALRAILDSLAGEADVGTK